MPQDSTAVVRAVGTSASGGRIREFFLVSAGTLTKSGVVTQAGKYTGYGNTAVFSSAGLKPGPAYLVCHAQNTSGQTVSSTSQILITAKAAAKTSASAAPAAPRPQPKPLPPFVTCTGPSSVNAGDQVQITATAINPVPSGIRYLFETSAGSISQSGNTAVLNTAGLSQHAVAVTCMATNSANATAFGTTTVQINSQPGEQAKAAFQFTDSVGVNIHLHFGETLYWQAFPQVMASMVAMGIHHYRNGIDPWVTQNEYDHAQALAHAGIKADWLIDRQDTAQNINDIYAKAPDSIEAFEGPNEADNIAGPVLINFQKLLHDTVKGNPATANAAVYAPTVTSLDGLNALGDLSAYADNGNMHDYYNPRFPETPAYGGTFFNCGAYGTMSFNICLAQRTVPNKNVVTTETGYISGQVSDVGSGRYIPRLLFSHLNQNVNRTYLYEFIDETNSNYGLVHMDFTPKPAYTAVKNLTALFGYTNFSAPGKLAYTLSGNTNNVQHSLFQRSDGTYLLAIWLGVASANGMTTLYTAPQNVTLTTTTPVGGATIYTLDDNGNMSSNPGYTSSSTTTLSVTDRVTVVALPPR